MMENFTFELVWVFLLLPLPWVVQFLLPSDETSNVALKTPYFRLWLSSQGDEMSLTKKAGRIRWYFLLAYLLLLVAAAKPMWIGDPVSLPVTGRDLMLAIDLSGSMENPDFLLDGKQVDRLTVVKNVAGDFIQRRKGDRIGLILFGKRAYVQTPLTFDLDTVKYMLGEAEIGLAGKETAIGDGIGLAVKRLRDKPLESRVLILLTDGANTAGELDPLKAAELAKENGLKIYTIGVGAATMEIQTFFGSRKINPAADLDEATLSKIAEMTGGAYFRAKDTKGLEKIYQQLDELEPAAEEAETLRPEISLYYWPLSFAVFIVLLHSLAQMLRGTNIVRGGQRA